MLSVLRRMGATANGGRRPLTLQKRHSSADGRSPLAPPPSASQVTQYERDLFGYRQAKPFVMADCAFAVSVYRRRRGLTSFAARHRGGATESHGERQPVPAGVRCSLLTVENTNPVFNHLNIRYSYRSYGHLAADLDPLNIQKIP